MHRSKAACNQDKITHEYWRVVRMTNFLSEIMSCYVGLFGPLTLKVRSWIKQISVTYFNVQLIRRPLSLNMNEQYKFEFCA